MNTKSIITVFAALPLAGAVLFGQTINPTVEVTNSYQGKASEIHKPLQVMTVPDSLLRFDLDFDYEVFDKPYEGAYNFKPYMLNMRPGRDAYRGRSLFLKAGAGYSLHPELEFVYSPEQKGVFQMSVYASHKSFFGDYSEISPELKDGILKLRSSGGRYSGYDALTTAGFDGRCSWDKTILSFGAGYYGVAAKDTIVKRSYNALDFNVRVASNNPDDESAFFYDAGLHGRVASDNLDYSLGFQNPDIPKGKSSLSEGGFVLEGSAGAALNSSHRLLAGFEASTYSYSNLFKSSAGRISVTPKYEFKTGLWNISLGVKLEAILNGSSADTLNFAAMNKKKGQIVYPDVRVSFKASDNVLLYASARGGSDLNAYSSSLSKNHFFAPSFSLGNALMDNSIETVNLALGAKGNISSRLQFDVKGGYANFDNGLMDRILPYSFSTGSVTYLPSVTYVDYDLLYADILLGWKSRNLTIDAALHYRNTMFPYENDSSKKVVDAFELPSFSGGLRAVYDISPRIYAGLSVEAAMRRNGNTDSGTVSARIPGYVDLGIFGGYQFNRKFGFYLQTGNLIGMDIQRNPLRSEKGPWGTVGITLNL